MPVNESSLRVTLETITRLKITRKEIDFNSASTTIQTNKCCGLYFLKKFDVFIILVAIKSLSSFILRSPETC